MTGDCERPSFMFKQLANVAQMMKQAQALQGQLQGLKQRLETVRVVGLTAGVEVEVTGDQRVVAVRIGEPALNGDRSRLEQSILEATNQALEKSRVAAAEAMQAASGEGGGFGDLLSQFNPSH
jgi:nucleoid-associated protein EbfC